MVVGYLEPVPGRKDGEVGAGAAGGGGEGGGGGVPGVEVALDGVGEGEVDAAAG